MFFVPFLIMLREGLEAALLVSLIASYLTRTGRSQWMGAIWAGAIMAALLCFAIGWGINETTGEFPQKQQELFEGIVALVAVGMLSYMVFWMRRVAGNSKADLEQAVERALGGGSNRRQALALVGMVFLAVAREGMESVFFLLAAFQQDVGVAAPAGALIGLFTAIILGFIIYFGGTRLPLGTFFRWSSVFILFVAAGLAAGAIRAFHEAGLWNHFQGIAFNLSQILSTHSLIGTLLEGLLGYQETPSVSEVGIYLLYLIPALLLFFREPRQSQAGSNRLPGN